MNKKTKLLIKLIGIIFVAAAFIMPLVVGTLTIEWVNDEHPSGATAEFNGDVFSVGISEVKFYNVTYNDTSGTFESTKVTDSNDEFFTAVTALQKVLQVLFLIGLMLSIMGALLSQKETKFGGFLMSLGIIATFGIVILAILFQTIILDALVSMGGVSSGQSVYFDNIVNDGSQDYTWRMTDTITLGNGVYLLIGGILIQFVSLFLSVKDNK